MWICIFELHEIRIICFRNYHAIPIDHKIVPLFGLNLHFSREFMTLPPNRIDSDSFLARNSFFWPNHKQQARSKDRPKRKVQSALKEINLYS